MSDQVPQEFLLSQILHTRETVVFRESSNEYPPGTLVVLASKYGSVLCETLGTIKADAATQFEEVLTLVRAATEADLEYYESIKSKEYEAYDVCRLKVDEHKLEMKLVSVHCVLDEAKMIFFFTSENRVDFRDLVKDLVAAFHMRIELRQIGVRDESRILGGLAVCGRALCCNSISDRLLPVSIKMAKVQNLSLNSMKISGPCGRLLCCLAYEYDAYKEDRKDMPPDGLVLPFGGHTYQVREASVLARKVHVKSSDDRYLVLPLSAFSFNPGNRQWTLIGPIPEL